MDDSLSGSSVWGIFQARILEWVTPFLLQGIFPTQGLNPQEAELIQNQLQGFTENYSILMEDWNFFFPKYWFFFSLGVILGKKCKIVKLHDLTCFCWPKFLHEQFHNHQSIVLFYQTSRALSPLRTINLRKINSKVLLKDLVVQPNKHKIKWLLY